MKRLFILMAVSFLTIYFLHGQNHNKEMWIKDIRLKYSDIRMNLDSYTTDIIDIWGESAEGGEVTAYYDNEEIKLIKVIWYGETGKRQIEYYFYNEKLIFSFNQNFKYNRSIWWSIEDAELVGDDELFDPKKTIIIEDRYYFKNDRLFLWLDHDKNEVDLTLDSNLNKGEKLLMHSYEMKAKLKK